MPPSRLVLLLPLVPLLASCAPAMPWMHPTLPKERWSDDYSACRADADRHVGWRDDDAPNPLREYDRIQGKKQFDGMVGACMRGQGYVPVRKGK